MKTVELLFWIALLLVFYTYLGYGLLLAPAVWLRERIRPRPGSPPCPTSCLA